MEMDISQYKDLFITEAQEHLDALNKFLLQLESDPRNLDVVTEIFRSAHTLKGMSATMGYDQLTELAHEMENLLEHLRTGSIEITTLVVDTLFSCFDTLGAIISGIAEDSPEQIDYGPLVSEIRSIIEGVEAEKPPKLKVKPEVVPPVVQEEPLGIQMEKEGPGEAVEEETPPEEEVEGEVGEEPAEEGREGEAAELVIKDEELQRFASQPGVRVILLNVELDEGCLLKSVRVFMVFKKLAQLGEVLGSVPPVEALEDEKFEYSFQVGLATQESPSKVEKSLLAIAEIADVTAEVVQEPQTGVELQERQAAKRPEEGAPMRAARKTQSVRVNIARLDVLMNLVGELVINKTRLSEIANRYKIPELREALDKTSSLTSELQDEVMKTRMVPVEHVFNRFPRMVRDLARDQGKEIDFRIEGKEIELDRTILDEISDPLIHMLRNAVDHGISTPEEREGKGKPGKGTIRLCAYRDRNYVAIEVEDDGEGIDPYDVFERALEKGLVSEDERAQFTSEDLLRVLAMPGFSTSEKVDGVSGRGVGMDAVKSKAESLGGFVILDAVRGKGTKITLKLPLTLAIVQALMVEVSGEIYAVPLGTVRETQVIDASEIKTVQNHEAVFLREETIPLVRLDAVLGCDEVLNGSEPFPIVITEMGTRLVAIGVHSLIGQQEIVISTMDEFLKRVEGFAGATILGTGRVALILDIPSLMQAVV